MSVKGGIAPSPTPFQPPEVANPPPEKLALMVIAKPPISQIPSSAKGAITFRFSIQRNRPITSKLARATNGKPYVRIRT